MVLASGFALATIPAIAQAGTAHSPEILELWPGPPPGLNPDIPIERRVDDQSRDPGVYDRWIRGIARPMLEVWRPAKPNGAAMLIVPGGGYGFLSYDNEGVSQAQWLNARGITAFILFYRLPGEGWQNREVVPLQDAQRAMRLIRSKATDFGIDTKRVGVLGFSAGGHLAGSLATRHAEVVYESIDAADSLSARPDIAGLIYPVISLEADFTHGGTRDNLLGTGATPEAKRAASVNRRVTSETPPVFLLHANDDGAVPVANSIAMYEAMQADKLPVALHIFEAGGHGFGVRLPANLPASKWPELFAAFAAGHGLIQPPAE
ncbi:alpha/beta hydrolase [Altererythrobacter sp.]|uniref:alpha/beta hydrolase n=1 Tax=Altererythrobacter sp. TaxID=1872480 RepID=UPI003CFF9616